MQPKYTSDFISLSQKTLREEGDLVKKWAKSAENPLVQKVCRHMLAAAGQATV